MTHIAILGTCEAHSSPATITKYCVLDKSSHSAGFVQADPTIKCTCDPGYEYAAGVGDDRLCKRKSAQHLLNPQSFSMSQYRGVTVLDIERRHSIRHRQAIYSSFNLTD